MAQGTARPQSLQHLVAVELRHQHVEQHQIEPTGREQLQRHLTVLGSAIWWPRRVNRRARMSRLEGSSSTISKRPASGDQGEMARLIG